MARIISIHALRTEGDCLSCDNLSQLPHISIHALRTEGDQLALLIGSVRTNFYPRPPYGGRRFTAMSGAKW